MADDWVICRQHTVLARHHCHFRCWVAVDKGVNKWLCCRGSNDRLWGCIDFRYGCRLHRGTGGHLGRLRDVVTHNRVCIAFGVCFCQ
jgi:hypothetical protein